MQQVELAHPPLGPWPSPPENTRSVEEVGALWRDFTVIAPPPRHTHQSTVEWGCIFVVLPCDYAITIVKRGLPAAPR